MLARPEVHHVLFRPRTESTSGEGVMKYNKELLKPLSEWRHIRTGGTYTVIGLALCSTNDPRELKEESVVYWSQTYRALRYREVSEFLDGRFYPLDADGSALRLH
jgi:hypothetical protein